MRFQWSFSDPPFSMDLPVTNLNVGRDGSKLGVGCLRVSNQVIPTGEDLPAVFEVGVIPHTALTGVLCHALERWLHRYYNGVICGSRWDFRDFSQRNGQHDVRHVNPSYSLFGDHYVAVNYPTKSDQEESQRHSISEAADGPLVIIIATEQCGVLNITLQKQDTCFTKWKTCVFCS